MEAGDIERRTLSIAEPSTRSRDRQEQVSVGSGMDGV